MTCPIAQAVAHQVTHRAEAGLKKYGVNAARTDLTLGQWLQHLQEELLDAAVYVERLKKEVPPEPPTSTYDVNRDWYHEWQKSAVEVISLEAKVKALESAISIL